MGRDEVPSGEGGEHTVRIRNMDIYFGYRLSSKLTTLGKIGSSVLFKARSAIFGISSRGTLYGARSLPSPRRRTRLSQANIKLLS